LYVFNTMQQKKVSSYEIRVSAVWSQ
jgi:hypothetical protein